MITSRPMTDDLALLKHRLYARAQARDDELAAAMAARGGAPDEADRLDFLDFFALEWVDAEGLTEVERAVADGALPAEALGWSREVRTAVWVVDGWEGDGVLLRDVGTEDEILVHAPGLGDDLPRRAVTRARVIPWRGGLRFSGAPDIWEPMGVIARMDLHRAWVESGEPALLAHLQDRRAGFLRQREEREAFVAFFGADAWVAADAAALEDHLGRFVHYLLNEHPMPSLGGRTRAVAFKAAKGDEPAVVRFTLGPTLTGPGRHAIVYDAVEGVHFLPAYGEFADTLRGDADHVDVLRLYADDPGITRLPFERVGATAGLVRHLGLPDEPLPALLDRVKGPRGRARPSVLPGFED